MHTRTRVLKSLKAKVLTALSCFAMLFGVGAAVTTVATQQENEVVETKAGDTSSLDINIVVGVYNEVGSTWLEDGTTYGAIYYWGTGISAKTVKLNKLTNYLGYATVPAGITAFKAIRAHDIEFPYSGFPTGYVYNEYGDQTYYSSKNFLAITGWGSNDQSYDGYKTIIPTGTSVFLDVSAVNSFWYNDDANTYLYNYLNSSFYGYNSYNESHQMTRIGSTDYFYYTSTTNIVAEGIIFTRNPSSFGWANQTTNVTVNYGYSNWTVLHILNTKDSSGHYDWSAGTHEETAIAYGAYFLDLITCSGSGSVTGGSNWSTVETMYNSLSQSVQYLLFETPHATSGNNLVLALWRYDYIQAKRISGKYTGYDGYNDFINRTNTSGGGGYVSPLAAWSVGPSVSESSPLTLTLWIVLGAGLAGMGAIGAAYFVSKKKKKHQA